MRVRIVCYENVDSWILGKLARNLDRELKRLGVESTLAAVPDPAADINHHIAYINYTGEVRARDTLMITHVDRLDRALQLGSRLKQAEMGICFSAEAVSRLAGAGMPREKLCFVSPAHDGELKPRRLAVGVTMRLYPDGRKLEGRLLKLCAAVSPEDFMFRIMGEGWEPIVDRVRALGFEVEHYPAFDRAAYAALMPSLDYYLYFAEDEGSMGFIDALAAGVKTVVTPQGFHLDAQDGITHRVTRDEDLAEIFSGIAAERRKLTAAVSGWTWENYARKHLRVWKYVLDRSSYPGLVLEAPSGEKDGIASVALRGAPPDLRAKAAFWKGVAAGSLRSLPHFIASAPGLIKRKLFGGGK